jgi:hypothetical protein
MLAYIDPVDQPSKCPEEVLETRAADDDCRGRRPRKNRETNSGSPHGTRQEKMKQKTNRCKFPNAASVHTPRNLVLVPVDMNVGAHVHVVSVLGSWNMAACVVVVM